MMITLHGGCNTHIHGETCYRATTTKQHSNQENQIILFLINISYIPIFVLLLNINVGNFFRTQMTNTVVL